MHAHFAARASFARWEPRTLRHYAEHGTRVLEDGSRVLAFDREIELAIYRSLPTMTVVSAARSAPAWPPRPAGRRRSRSAVTWAQSWLVALVFAVMGGVGALVAGLVVATFVLLHDSAAKVLRHVRLDGELRSRRLRRDSIHSRLPE